MDPLPNVNKAYYIVQQIEKQKQVTHPSFEPTTFFANLNGHKAGYQGKKDVLKGLDIQTGIRERKVRRTQGWLLR